MIKSLLVVLLVLIFTFSITMVAQENTDPPAPPTGGPEAADALYNGQDQVPPPTAQPPTEHKQVKKSKKSAKKGKKAPHKEKKHAKKAKKNKKGKRA